MSDNRNPIQSPPIFHIYQTRLRTFTFKRWSGATTTVEAEAITFTDGGGIVFTTGDRIILGVPKQDWWDVREVEEAPGD